MNANLIPLPDLRDNLDDLAEQFAIVVNRVRHAVKRDERRAHSQRKGAKHEREDERGY